MNRPPPGFFDPQAGFQQPFYGQYHNIEMRMMYDIFQYKSQAELALERGSFAAAERTYSCAIDIVRSAPPACYNVFNEFPKLLSNRSLVFTKLKNFQAAARDAEQCVQIAPDWTKGYWRLSQALKGLGEEYRALTFLVNGYNLCRIDDTDSDTVTFLSDMLSTICLISDDPHEVLEMTKPVSSRDCPGLVSKVLLRLATSNCWEAVSLLVTGIHSGPTNHFEEIACRTDASGISVGALINNLPVSKMSKWGVRLAIALLKNGSSVQDMEMRLAKPALHIGIDLAIKTGKADFLKFLFEFCVKTKAMKDAVDNHGNTVLHLLVQSGKINTTLGETILRLLINNGCSTNIRNADQKTPIQYLRPDDQGYVLLQSAEKQAVEDLKQLIIKLKEDGNKAHRDCNHDLAVDLYSQAIDLCNRYLVLRNEMAVLLTNRSAVFSIKGKHQRALDDAIKAIEVDGTWNKGHWRKGQVLRTLGRHKESFDAFWVGYNSVPIKDIVKAVADKTNFLMESIICMQYLNHDEDFFRTSYNKLKCVSESEWNHVVGKLSKNGEWLAIRIIVVGSNQMVRDFQNRSNSNDTNAQRFEGLGFRVSYTGLTLSTIFPFLRRHIGDTFVCSWITRLLVLLLESGELSNLLTFVEDENDTPLHAAVKFSIMAGNSLIVSQLPFGEYSNVVDRYGDSAFHVITKKPPIQNIHNRMMVAKVLLDKGVCVTVIDRNGKMPIEYLKRDDSDPLYTLLKSHCSVAPILHDQDYPVQLREQGNVEFKKRNFPGAVELYSKAIQLTNVENSFNLARLHGNRMECFLRMKLYVEALDDALDSVSYDGHWYKAHFRVGKAQSALGNYDAALKAFTNSFNALDSNATENMKKEILIEFAIHGSRLGLLYHPVKAFNNVTAELWAKTAYEMVLKKEYDGGHMAFRQSTLLDLGSVKFKLDLKPLCEMTLLRTNEWLFEFIHLLLMFGSDHETISLQPGDTYLNASVRMCLLVEGSEHVMVYILDTIVVPKQQINIVDIKGNTALHTVARDPNVSVERRVVMVHILLQRDIDTMIKNGDGRLAVEYIPKLEFQSLDIIINRMNSQQALSKKLKQQVKKQEEIQRIQIEKEERQREKERLQRQKQQQEKQRQQKLQQQQREAEQAKRKQDNQCGICERHLQEGIDHLSKLRTGKAYNSLANVLRHKKDNYHKTLHDQTLNIIIKSVANTLNPDIPERLAKIPVGLYERFINGLAQLEKYKQMDIAVVEFRKHHGDMALRDYASSINVAKVIRHSSLLGQDDLLARIIDNMLNSGAALEKGGKMCILGALQEEHYKILCTLFDKGADPSHLSLQNGDTPLHAALSIALERDKGNFTVLDYLLDKYESNPEKHSNLDPAQQDMNGDGLFHMVAKMKYSSNTQKATELLCDRKISALCLNNEGKLPKDYLMNKKNDRRLQFFRLASVDGPGVVKPAKKSKSKSEKSISRGGDAEKISEEDEQADLLSYNRTDETEISSSDKTWKSDKKFTQVRGTLHRDIVKKKIEDLIYDLPDTKYSIFNPKPPKPEESWKPPKGKDEPVVQEKPEEKREELVETAAAGDDLPEETEEVNGEVTKEEQDSEEEEEGGTDQDLEAETFDNLEWEVECTSEVWKTLRDKHVLPELKQRCIKKICQLARGEWRPSLCKVILNVPSTLHLYEAKLSKGGRIIWELAVAFSPRLSETADRRLHTEGETDEELVVRGGRIYSEIIRVWDVVFNHDHIYRSVQNIIKSHNRGEECIIQRKLKGEKHKQFKSGGGIRVPLIYTEADAVLSQGDIQDYQDSLHQFFPPASSNETEYHILKFYSFSSNLVHHVLQNIDTKVDFPFRVTDLEHAIINLQSEAPILLLGRSGTGKTTCCLYRLWAQFMKYWNKASEADGPLLPRCPAFLMENDDGEEDEEEEEVDEGVVEEGGTVEEEELDSNDEETEHGQIYDHLHQVFITKNAVLCSEVQKNFRELSHACEVATRHVQIEENPIPSRLQEMDEYQYPLFITSKKLMLMLDASLGKPYFFDRDEDGNLKADIEGWTDGEGTLSILPLLAEDSEDEEEDDDQFDDIPDELEENAHRNRRDKIKRDARREVTYDVFSFEIWPKIAKKFSGKYHPSLIWTEIMSFIKGSFEALSKPSGTLTKEEYFELGKKRAPNFSGQREHVYELYKRYDHFKRMKFLFDETDLVRHVYNRLKQETEMQWVIHQIFVDETQDFTQAELCLLLRICQNPNQMFLTGDTAQSIMRGIAFRFNDLKSLFYYAQRSMHAMGDTLTIEVPKKVHQLTHNYRSHAGILSLACSILDLMVRFFPESFDRLQKDQGLFHGPPPVLLESCSFSDLAVLLRGNRRKTSHIEFGAHQAILVVDDAARESLPEELQLGLILTIYEAKGLEFDDILLYNFFKDSQAGKEWRVVTEYLEEMAATTLTKDSASKESLVEIDADVLQLCGRPRPLKFDPNHHKVLNSELKHLYTAVTRARVNVWIFDEDVDKRAPMFEYFKARKLVKKLTSVEVDDEGVGGVFAEQSSNEDWVRRGEDFMRHALYEVAAKCFSRGGDEHLVKVAQAHQQALVASRTKANHQRMRDEFLLAAQQFLDCSLPSQAAKCLLNARERELVAFLYEKIGQLERAAETYRRLKKPIESSRCYEQLGMYNLALDTLCENEYYEMAIEAIVRYEKLKNRCEKELSVHGTPFPVVLMENAPGDQHTQERLSYKAAIQYHRSKNEPRMLKNLDRMPKLSDRIDFLKRHGYYDRAAELFEREGRFLDAARLYLTYCNTQKAIESARKAVSTDLLAECLLVHAQVTMRGKEFKSGEATDEKVKKQEEIIQNLQEAIDLSMKICDHDTRGEACFLKGELTQEITDINESWGSFNKCQPRNEAGQLECMDWMVYHSSLDTMETCRQVVKGMQNLFGVLQVLLSPSRPEEKRRVDRIYNYYGLKPCSNFHILKLCPVQKPRALKILNKVIAKVDRKKSECEVPREQAKLEICKYLLDRGHQWYGKVDIAVNNVRQIKMQCPAMVSGRECKLVDCKHNHTKIQSKKMLLDLLEVDLLMMKLEHYVVSGAKKIQKSIPIDLKENLRVFIPDYGPDKPPEFYACNCLLQDMMPKHYLPWSPFGRPDFCKDIRRRVDQFDFCKDTRRREFFVKDHIREFLQTYFYYMEKHENKKSSDYFVKLIFMNDYFSLRDVSLQNILIGYENKALQDMGDQAEKSSWKRLESLGFLVSKHRDDQTGNKNVLVSCIARRFYDAYEQLSIKGDAMESLIKFTKFIVLLGDRNKTILLPEYHHFLLWLEFFTTVGLCLSAKLNQVSKVFFLPTSYISTVHFIDSSFIHSNGAPTFELVQRHKPGWNTENNLAQNRVQRIMSLLCGTQTNMNLIRLLFKYKEGKPMNYPIAERLLVLCLTCICNMGKGMLHCELEADIMENLSKVTLPEDCPPRLMRAIQSVQAAESQEQVANCLKNLLMERCDEEIKLCAWGSDRYGIRHETLQKVSLFNSEFNNSYTLSRMSNPTASIDQVQTDTENITDEILVNETEMEMEEKLRLEKERNEHQQEEKENKAASFITRSIRRKILLNKYTMLSVLVEEQLNQEKNEERLKVFKDITIDDTMCGVCGVHYQRDETTAGLENASSPEMEQRKKNPFASLFTNETPQPTIDYTMENVSRSISEDLSEDLSEERKFHKSELRERHEDSDHHRQKNMEFILFKKKYKKDVAPPLETISDFISTYKLGSTKEVGKYKNMPLDIQRLVCYADEVQTLLQKFIGSRAWEKFGELQQKSKEMEGSYNAVREYVEKTHKELQEESERVTAKVVSSGAQRDEDWDENLLEILEPVVDRPKKMKTIPKGRGRGRRKQED